MKALKSILKHQMEITILSFLLGKEVLKDKYDAKWNTMKYDAKWNTMYAKKLCGQCTLKYVYNSKWISKTRMEEVNKTWTWILIRTKKLLTQGYVIYEAYSQAIKNVSLYTLSQVSTNT